MAKRKQVTGEPVAGVVARGDAEIGFEQVSELIPVPGVDYVGLIPREVQKVTIFSAGIAVGAQHPKAAGALIKFLASPAAAPALKKSGLEPIKPH
jgi:molybdate transport system substrate-binding protein